ncbi:MAG: hypothetical protein R3C56_38365 [Pirellulaceae bacterium]
MALTRRMQRLGDLAAGTMVISEAHTSSLRPMTPEDPRAFGLAELIPATFSASHSLAQAIGHYMENRQVRALLLGEAKFPSTWPNHCWAASDCYPIPVPIYCYALYTRIFLSAEEQGLDYSECVQVALGLVPINEERLGGRPREDRRRSVGPH